MTNQTSNKKFGIGIPLAITIILLSFFLIFRGALTTLISGGDCLQMEFFKSKINTCNASAADETLIMEQKEISGFVQSLKNTIDRLEDANNDLTRQVYLLERKLAKDPDPDEFDMPSDAVLSDEQRMLYDKYSVPSKSNSSGK